ncbi:MAG: hypothetical protein MUE42_13715 [Opitutaceae bacterium]|jgi:hypothetical protein|nr:hypothetical protein [Opitutaceae bacterium]
MKLLATLLGLSLCANAAFLVWAPNRGVAEAERASAETASPSGAAVATARGPATGDGRAIAAALRDGDNLRLRDELLAAGLDEETVRDLVRARIHKRFEARFAALHRGNGVATEWWKQDDWSRMTREKREEMRALQRELDEEFRRVLGEGMMAETLRNNPWMGRKYGFLPAEKREALWQLEQDYNQLSEDLSSEAQDFRMPEDAEKYRFLEEEKRRDIAELLGPEDFAAYERRNSRTANDLGWRMTRMDATEAEFMAVFEIQKEFDDVYNNHDPFGNTYTDRSSPEKRKARAEAEKAMRAEIRAALGDERYKVYVRSQDHDYQQLQNASRRFALPADTPARVYDLRDEVPQAALAIAKDETLAPEEKKVRVSELAADTRARLDAMLGADLAKVAVEQMHSLQWLRQLDEGTIITYDESGSQSHQRLEQFNPKPAPAKAKR